MRSPKRLVLSLGPKKSNKHTKLSRYSIIKERLVIQYLVERLLWGPRGNNPCRPCFKRVWSHKQGCLSTLGGYQKYCHGAHQASLFFPVHRAKADIHQHSVTLVSLAESLPRSWTTIAAILVICDWCPSRKKEIGPESLAVSETEQSNTAGVRWKIASSDVCDLELRFPAKTQIQCRKSGSFALSTPRSPAIAIERSWCAKTESRSLL